MPETGQRSSLFFGDRCHCRRSALAGSAMSSGKTVQSVIASRLSFMIHGRSLQSIRTSQKLNISLTPIESQSLTENLVLTTEPLHLDTHH